MIQSWKDTNIVLVDMYVQPALGTLASNPTANLHVGAGIAAATGAPFKIDPGVVLTTPENGAIETDGTHLYWTDSTAARRQLDQQASSPAVPVSFIGTNVNAFVVGQTAAGVNPAFTVDTSTGSSVTGVIVKSRVLAGGASLYVTSSGSNEALTIDAKGSGTITLGSVSTGAISLNTATTVGSTLAVSGTLTVTSNSAAAFAVGRLGATTPAFQVNASAGTAVTGLLVTSAAAAGGVAVQVTSGGATESMTIDAKAGGLITLAGAAATAIGVTIGSTTSAANVIATVYSSNATAFQVGPNGSTNPSFIVNASTSSAVGGLKLTGAATTVGIALQAIDSGATCPITIDAKAGAMITLAGAAAAATGVTVGSSTSAANATLIVYSSNAAAFVVGANGATNPVFKVVASTGSVATGLAVTGAATGGTTAVVATDSGANTSLTVDGKGTGTVGINTVSTTAGVVTLGNSTQLAGIAVNGKVVINGTLTAGGLLTSALQIAVSGPLLYSGSGAPTIVPAVQGSLYLRSDGSATNNRLYICTGTTSGTWIAFTTPS